MGFDEKTIEMKRIYEGKILDLELHTVELCNKNTAQREIVRHRGAVAIIPVTENNEIILVRQFRKPFDMELLEIPAGKLEKGEDPEECAHRELKEETGYSADKLSFLTIMLPAPGYSDEKIHIYKAEGLKEGVICPDEDEFLNTEIYTLKQAVEMVKSGAITDAKTAVAILLAASNIK